MKFGNKRIVQIGILAVISVMILGSCTVYDNFKASFIDKKSNDNVIYIGVIEPQTGKMSDRGKEEIRGIELANSIYNNVKGYDVRFAIVDTHSSTEGAESAIKSLIKLDPVAIIGTVGEANSLVVSEYIKESKIPTITPSCVNPLITQDNGYYFRACITDNQMGAGLSEYAYSVLGSRNIALIDVENDNTVSAVIDGFKNDMKTRAGNTKPIVLNITIKPNEENANKVILDKIKKSKADIAFVPIGVEAADSFFKEVEKKDMTDVTFLGTGIWASNDFAKICKKHPNIKVAFPSDYVVGENKSMDSVATPETQRFMIEYQSKYGADEVPSQYSALGYDSYLLIMNAIDNSVSIKHADVRDALAATRGIQCATGVFNFDKKGNTIRGANIASVENGKIVTVYSTMDTSKAGVIKELE